MTAAPHPFLIMDRERYARVVDFFLSEQSMGDLVAAQEKVLFADALSVVRADLPVSMALTDPVLYRRIRARITELRIAGYGVS